MPHALVDDFLIRLARADRRHWILASRVVGSDEAAWRLAGARARHVIRDNGLIAEFSELQLRAKVTVQMYAAGLPEEQARLAIWAAQGTTLGLLARPGITHADLRQLCGPFAELLRVWVTGGGTHYHATETCQALVDGQAQIEQRGGKPAKIMVVSVVSGNAGRRSPCGFCMPADAASPVPRLAQPGPSPPLPRRRLLPLSAADSAPLASGLCPKHRVPLTYDGCHVCRRSNNRSHW
jgi:hypothetical protein